MTSEIESSHIDQEIDDFKNSMEEQDQMDETLAQEMASLIESHGTEDIAKADGSTEKVGDAEDSSRIVTTNSSNGE